MDHQLATADIKSSDKSVDCRGRGDMGRREEKGKTDVGGEKRVGGKTKRKLL